MLFDLSGRYMRRNKKLVCPPGEPVLVPIPCVHEVVTNENLTDPATGQIPRYCLLLLASLTQPMLLILLSTYTLRGPFLFMFHCHHLHLGLVLHLCHFC